MSQPQSQPQAQPKPATTQPQVVAQPKPVTAQPVKPATTAPVKAAPKPGVWDKIQPFVIGGASGCTATSFIQPVDMIKVRIQLKSEEISKLKKEGKAAPNASVSPFTVMKEVYKTGGIKFFYRGIDSALVRQIFYTTTRLGVYKSIFQSLKDRAKGRNLTFGEKSFCSLSAGFIGSIIGNPADLALIRMQYDTTVPAAERRNYKNVVDAFTRIVKEEGFFSLWRGCTPTVIRAMVLNFGMLGPYDEAKERIMRMRGMKKEDNPTRLLASAIAGFFASFLSLPFDNAKTKMQKMKKGADGKFPYANIFDALWKTIRNEGVVGLWVGFPTFYFRIAPHTMITLLVQDYLTDKVTKYRQGKKN